MDTLMRFAQIPALFLCLATAMGCGGSDTPVSPDSPLASATGTWRGQIMSSSCMREGAFGETFCNSYPTVNGEIGFTLTQNGDTVTGHIDLGGNIAPITSGRVTGGRLSIVAQGPAPGPPPSTAIYESWDSAVDLVNTNRMTGAFTIRVFATAGSPSGSAQYRVTFDRVFRPR